MHTNKINLKIPIETMISNSTKKNYLKAIKQYYK